MGADISRVRHDPLLDFCGVDLQQGRVLSDADMNELMAIVDRRVRALASDTLGRATVGANTPDAFKIDASGGELTIGRGRLYVDGLLAENHGTGPSELDPLLAETRHAEPVPYDEQPYWPTPAPLPESGKHLVYLDAWLREVTWLEHPDLIEPALGVDTTTRTQTVWQVRLLENVGANATCATPDAELPGWAERTRPSGARLSSFELGVAPAADPCMLPPTGGYRGLENQTYRIEIHKGGKLGEAAFKWSRENASVATRVVEMNAAGTVLTVAAVMRDDVLRFSTGDWIEVTDDHRELARLPGDIRRVTVDDARRTLTLDGAIGADLRETDPDVLAARHFRVRRWDQHGEVRDDAGNPVVDLDAAGAAGVIPIDQLGRKIVLEDGLAVAFDLDPEVPGGELHAGDYWVIAARTATASVEILDRAPPRGIHHHYARLALVTFPDDETDCRTLWPPKTGGESCACTLCVTPESHASGALTIQRAIDEVQAAGGTVCLAPGRYALDAPLAISDARSLRLKGHGSSTVLTAPGSGIVVRGSRDVTLEEFALVSGGARAGADAAVSLAGSIGVRMERCLILQAITRDGATEAVSLEGALLGTVLRDNVLIGIRGISASLDREEGSRYLVTAGLVIEDNVLWCQSRGVSLEGACVHFATTRIRSNLAIGCAQGGIVATGATLAGDGLDVCGNNVVASGDGIVVGVDGVRVEGNDVRSLAERGGGDGIVLALGLDETGIDRGQILGNRVFGMSTGIVIKGPVRSCMIDHNIIEGARLAGIDMQGRGLAESLVVQNNQIKDVAAELNEASDAAAGIRLLRVGLAAVVGNMIRGVGAAAVQGIGRFGIQATGVARLRVDGNEIVGVGPREEFVGLAVGIYVVGPFEDVDIAGNRVLRESIPDEPPSRANSAALAIVRPEQRLRVSRFASVFTAGDHVLVLTDAAVAALSAGDERVSVRGNALEARGAVSVATVTTAGDCLLADNSIVQTSRSGTTTASVRAAAVIASTNRLRGPEFSLAIDADPKRVTVLGNIAESGIAVGGAPLAQPWNALNVTGV